ncbi:hypothetical protein IRJ41_014499 [Triplophysa rosa]|uniref:Uncharacterized protein n=1 Tax=Triplophysa rosa TaxID=992332 RepID=A0A9W7TFV7_TRIRA|nr:hypothetical protein IRJ41_014499 [Triplophysa rosa]
MLFCVIISPQNIKKVRLDPVPDSVDGLKLELKSRLQLKDPFDLQHEDEDFHDFCNLTCVADLPKDKATLKGKDRENLDKEREQIAVEMTKRTPDIIFVDAAMSSTYSLRRQEVNGEEPPVSQMKVRWPALLTERHSCLLQLTLTSLSTARCSPSFPNSNSPELTREHVQFPVLCEEPAHSPELREVLTHFPESCVVPVLVPELIFMSVLIQKLSHVPAVALKCCPEIPTVAILALAEACIWVTRTSLNFPNFPKNLRRSHGDRQ